MVRRSSAGFETGRFKPAFSIALLEVPKQHFVNFAFLGQGVHSRKLKVPAANENPRLMQTGSRMLSLAVLLKRPEQPGFPR